MAIEDTLKSLREFDLNDLDLDNIGSWPVSILMLLWVLVFAGVLFLGYTYQVEGLQQNLARAEQQEVDRKKEFEQKAFQAANLDAYKRQMTEMEDSFGALVSQLPSDTEVPGLLEDITNKGLANGLDIASIDLQDERAQEFYVELPIAIVASGSYHDLGSFVSSMASLPRIVTLHDFSIEMVYGGGDLRMNMIARTYRYRDEDS
jgi:type IV pilus assembly protein PilO